MLLAKSVKLLHLPPECASCHPLDVLVSAVCGGGIRGGACGLWPQRALVNLRMTGRSGSVPLGAAAWAGHEFPGERLLQASPTGDEDRDHWWCMGHQHGSMACLLAQDKWRKDSVKPREQTRHGTDLQIWSWATALKRRRKHTIQPPNQRAPLWLPPPSTYSTPLDCQLK